MVLRRVSNTDVLFFFFILVGLEASSVSAVSSPTVYISIPFWGLALAYGVFVSVVLFLGMYICYIKEKFLKQQTDMAETHPDKSLSLESTYEMEEEEEEEEYVAEVPNEAPSKQTECVYDDITSNEEEPIYEVVDYFEPFDRTTIYQVVDSEPIYEDDFQIHRIQKSVDTRLNIYTSSPNIIFGNTMVEEHRF